MGRRAVFLDRDGTVNVEADFLSDPELLVLESHAAEGLRALRDAGFTLLVVSNQSGVARGLFTENDVRRVNERLRRMLAEEGVEIAGLYYCPHHPEGTVGGYRGECECRKPAPGMFTRAAAELDLDCAASYTVGDRARDLEAGRRAGTRCVLVKTGFGENEVEIALEMKAADFVAEDLAGAAAWIIADAGGAHDDA